MTAEGESTLTVPIDDKETDDLPSATGAVHVGPQRRQYCCGFLINSSYWSEVCGAVI
jgi:hypothetical protein